jgi:predicted nucleotidyltransferase
MFKTKILPTIIDYYSPLKVILFGSKARQDDVPGSDLDIVVIAENNKTFLERLRESVTAVPYPNIDILVYTPREFEIMSQVENQFITTVLKEGKVVYESKR